MDYGEGIETADREFAPLFIAVIVAVIAAPIAFFAFHRPTPTPPANALDGCYFAPNSPTLYIAGGKLHFRQSGLAVAGFRIAYEKWGPFVIEPDRPVHLERMSNRSYAFAPGDGGMLWFMRPGHIVDGRPYGVADVRDAQYIEVTATDGSVLHFQPRSPRICGIAI